jgi:hypothetical protein
MPGPTHLRPRTLAAVAAAVGALVAVVLGFLTFGAQATAAPDKIPVAVAAPGAGPMRAVAEQVSQHGGGELGWRVTSPEQGRKLLEDKEVYGVLELGPGPSATVVSSGAVNPSGTQIGQQALTGRLKRFPWPPPRRAIRPSRSSWRLCTRLAWPGGPRPWPRAHSPWWVAWPAGAVLLLAARRTGDVSGVGARLVQVAGAGVLVTAVIAGFLKLWDASLPLDWDVLGFLFLAVTGFDALQAGLLRLLGVRAMAILGPLYLVAPAVAGQVPEMLNPAYRSLHWSWTPFRFSTEGLRSLLQGTPGAPDVATGIWVLAALLIVGLIVVAWPSRSADKQAEAHSPDQVVQVGVH